MEQVPVTVDEVRRILAGERPSTVSETDQTLVLGYRDAMEYVLRRADDPGFRWSRELVVALHDRVQAQLAQVRALDLRQRVERRIWEALEAVVEDARLQPRVVNAAWDAFFEREITPAYYMPLTDVSRATATNDLSAAVAAGLLEPRGAGRSRRYVTGPRLYEAVAAHLGIGEIGHEPRARIVAVLSRRLASSGSD